MTDTPELPPLPEPLPAMEWQHHMLTADQTRAYARAYAAEAVRVAQGWRPIETAPKDGTDVIVMYLHIDTQVTHNAYYATEADGYEEGDVGWWTYLRSEVSRELLNDWRAPTHWMPLPAAPKDHT